MLRRNALKNISLLTGGVFFLPYSCDLNPDFNYSNFPKLKRKEKRLINSICEVILPSDKINFPTSENRDIVIALNDIGKNVGFVEISSDKGHDSFLVDIETFSQEIKCYLKDI